MNFLHTVTPPALGAGNLLFFPTPVNPLDPSAAATLPQQMSTAGYTFPTAGLNATSSAAVKSGSGEAQAMTSEGSSFTATTTATATTAASAPTSGGSEADIGAQHNPAASLLESIRINGLLHGASTNPESCFASAAEGPSGEMVKVRYLRSKMDFNENSKHSV
ncbi:unnamed protein product [Taenia asiatica]|uniref:Uncharacterized protein n=1 Tax=Taenia asiatica TaxID=60517 RepID=A0A0R3VWV5_TAEAS|nr:unnamed protein product [Taenia asiatica]